MYEWLIVEIFFVLQSHKSLEHVLGAENPEFGQPNQTIPYNFSPEMEITLEG
jgi:hypothetical protein